MSYLVQTDVEAYLDITLTSNGAALFAALEPAMEDMIDNYCNRSWRQTNPITENFDAIDPANLKVVTTFFPSYPPVAAVTAVNVGSVPIDLNYVFNYKSYIKLLVSPVTVTLPNAFGYQQVVITYNTAATSLPLVVKQAMIEWIARKIQTSSDAGKETNKVQAGTVIAQYTTDKMGGMPDFVKLVLDLYRLPAIDHF